MPGRTSGTFPLTFNRFGGRFGLGPGKGPGSYSNVPGTTGHVRRNSQGQLEIRGSDGKYRPLPAPRAATAPVIGPGGTPKPFPVTGRPGLGGRLKGAVTPKRAAVAGVVGTAVVATTDNPFGEYLRERVTTAGELVGDAVIKPVAKNTAAPIMIIAAGAVAAYVLAKKV